MRSRAGSFLSLALVLVVLAGVLAACGSSDGGNDAGEAAAQEERVEVPPTLAEALMDAVRDGELGELEAATAGVGVVVGDAEPGDVVDVDVDGVDEHSMVRWAVAVEAETGDETLGALLDEVTVSTAQLDAASVGVTSADASGEDGETSLDEPSGGAGVVLTGSSSERPVAQGVQSCAEVTGDAGFPLAQCIEGLRYESHGVEVTVWHDADRPIDLGLADKIAAETDVALAWLTEFMSLPERVDVITAGALVGDDGEKFAGFASVGREPTDCVVAIVESAFAKPDRVGVLDHELVHCAQRATYASPYGPSTVWWYEGSADWAAAQINPEYGQLPYTRWSISKNLTRQSYQAWTFFQFVSQGPANPQAAFDLMASVDAGGGGQSALAAVAGIDNTWVDYAKAWVEGTIPAPDGGTLATSVPPTPYELRTSGDSVNPPVQAFAVEFVYIHVTDVDPDNDVELDIDAASLLGAYFENGWEQIPGGSGTWTLTSPDDPYARNTAVLIGTTQGDQAATANLSREGQEIGWVLTMGGPNVSGSCTAYDADIDPDRSPEEISGRTQRAYDAWQEASREVDRYPVPPPLNPDSTLREDPDFEVRQAALRAAIEAEERYWELHDLCLDELDQLGDVAFDVGWCAAEDSWRAWLSSWEVTDPPMAVFLSVLMAEGSVSGFMQPKWYSTYEAPFDDLEFVEWGAPEWESILGDRAQWWVDSATTHLSERYLSPPCLVASDPVVGIGPSRFSPVGDEAVPPFLQEGRMADWRCFIEQPARGDNSGPTPAPPPAPAPPPGGLGVVLTSSHEEPGGEKNWWCERRG